MSGKTAGAPRLGAASVLLALIFILALALRLLVWRWHARDPLGGDEQEYFNQALTLLRDHRYVELRLMRPPLYTGFLAACMYLLDSLVQRIRLIQAIVSALTVVPVLLLTQRLFGRWRVALLAALLCALSYTLAANASELLTETLFVLGLTTWLWLLLGAARDARGVRAGVAGLMLGGLILLRSVALPLLPLGALWLLAQAPGTGNQQPLGASVRRFALPGARFYPTLSFMLAAVLVVAPWSIRNYAVYGAVIVVDTTGAENLWLDNNPAAATPADPLGREAAKRALYELGDDRAARQRLAMRNGLAAIGGDPGWFARKAWGEAQKFFALQYFDDMRARRAIWLPPAEVWLRLLLGDGLWLVLLLGGTAGLWLYQRPGATRQQPHTRFTAHGCWCSDARWVFVPWALYTLLTAGLFHTELRYRLPLYPVLLPYAALALAQLPGRRARWGLRTAGAATTLLALAATTLLHRPYLGESWMLARKHYALSQSARALAAGDSALAQQAAQAALALDRDSALAQVALARAALLRADQPGALARLGAAIEALQAQPYAHLLRGAILRAQGDTAGATAEFAYERSSQEDLQLWSRAAFAPFAAPPAALEIGVADLGFVTGFWLPEPGGTRWTRGAATLLLAAPPGAGARITLELRAARPAAAPATHVQLLVNGQALGQFAPDDAWRSYSADVPAALIGPERQLLVELRSDTFRPRDYDRASPDDRALGVLVRSIALVAP